MTTFPAAAYITDNGRNEGEIQDALEDWLAATKQLPGGIAESALVVATGAIIPTGSAHTLDTEGAAASDDLTTITTTNLPEGSLLQLRAASASRVVTLKHNSGGAGKMSMIDSADIALDDVNITIWFQRRGTDWSEVRPIAPATTGRKGAVELATLAETIAAADLNRAVVPGYLFGVGGAVQQGKNTIWVPGGSITPRVSNPCGESTTETTTNKVVRKTKDFSPSANEYGQFSVFFPKSWNRSTLSYQYVWIGGSAGNVIMGMQAVAISNDDPIDAAFGAAVEITDTLISTGDQHVSAESGALTVGGSPAIGDEVIFQVYRNAASASDTMTGSDLRLVGIALYYTTNAKNDA